MQNVSNPAPISNPKPSNKPRTHCVTASGSVVYFCRWCGGPIDPSDELLLGPELAVQGGYWQKPVPVELDDWLGFCSIAHASLWLQRAISNQVDAELAAEWHEEEEAMQDEARKREEERR